MTSPALRNCNREASDADHPMSPRFSCQPVRGRHCGRSRRPGIARRRGAAGDDHDPDFAKTPPSAPHPSTSRTTCCGRKASRIYIRARRGGPDLLQMVGRGDIDFALDVRGHGRLSTGYRASVTALSGLHSGCLELFAHGAIQTIGDLKGRRVGIQSPARADTCTSRSWWRMSDSIPARTSTGSPLVRRGHGTVRRRQSRCSSRFPA